MPEFAGVPAFDVPQYWQRAAGFVDMFIAQTESRQCVKFAREHAAYDKPGTKAKQSAKNASFLNISLLLDKNYIKKRIFVQRKNKRKKRFIKLLLDNSGILSIL